MVGPDLESYLRKMTKIDPRVTAKRVPGYTELLAELAEEGFPVEPDKAPAVKVIVRSEDKEE